LALAIARAEGFSDQHVTFLVQLEDKESARKSENRHFFIISYAFSLYFGFSLWQIILFLLRITDFHPKKINLELRNLYIKKKSSSVSARKLKCPAQLDSGWKLFSSAQLRKFQLKLITKYK
jgi:hypothetical protein